MNCQQVASGRQRTTGSRKPSQQVRLVGLIILGVAAAGVRAGVPSYSNFQLQARTNLIVNDNGFNLPPGSSFNSITAHIDDQARVSFPVQVVPVGGSSAPGIWFGSGGLGALVYTGPVDALISSETHHNAAGTIVFSLSDTGGADGIYRYEPLTTLATRVSTSPLFPNSYSNVRITGAGAVGYQANFASGRGLASTGGGTFLHVSNRALDPKSPWTFIYTPAFNTQRVHFAKVATSGDFVTATEIRRFDSAGISQRLAANRGTDSSSVIRQFDNGLSVNNTGVIAFIAVRDSDGRRAVYRSDGITQTELAAVNPAGPITGLDFFRPAINGDGLVVFRAVDAGGQAIYVSDGVTLRRIIGRGDVLSTDLGLAQIGQNNASDAVFSGAQSINANGDVAFIAALHPDGNNQIEWGTGVFVASANLDTVFANGFE